MLPRYYQTNYYCANVKCQDMQDMLSKYAKNTTPLILPYVHMHSINHTLCTQRRNLAVFAHTSCNT